MAAAATQSQLSGLGRAMVQKGLLGERDAEQMQTRANEAGITVTSPLPDDFMQLLSQLKG